MSYWENEEFDKPDVQIISKELLNFDGVPLYCTIKPSDWDKIETMTFLNDSGIEFTNEYILTDRGYLRISSMRLRKQLKPFYKKKGRLVIQRWRDGKDNRSTIYKVQLEPAEIKSKK
ncbi:unnamed protein product [marine sediment metagenome]|uniref:Uncharacterized protein n=1 Tax=marine sediment metagenome TaxID=412755 RepID=X1APK4_9ZZZZ